MNQGRHLQYREFIMCMSLEPRSMKIGIISNLDANFETQKFTNAPVTVRQNLKLRYLISFISVELLRIQNIIKHFSYYWRFLKYTTVEWKDFISKVWDVNVTIGIKRFISKEMQSLYLNFVTTHSVNAFQNICCSSCSWHFK